MSCRKALLVGNSDGIGLAATKRLLAAGWDVVGISRSGSPLEDNAYRHRIADVRDECYEELLADVVRERQLDLCVYFAGIGEPLNLLDMSGEVGVIEVNLAGMVKTAAAVIPGMVKRRQGHFVGISSVADELISPDAPSYHASKAGFSNYLQGLAPALKPENVQVTNVRFGFVDTKMAKGTVRPFMMSVEKAVDHLEVCLAKRPVCYTAPKIVIPLVKFHKAFIWFSKTFL